MDSVDQENLDRALFELAGTVADITVKHNNGFLNVTVHGSRTGESDVTPPGADAGQPAKGFAATAGLTDEDIPY